MQLYYERHLPHWQPPGATIFLTWRLFGSLPASVIRRLEAERERLMREPLRTGETEEQRMIRLSKQLFALVDDYLDRAQSGPLWLKDARLAQLVVDKLLLHAQDLYTLWSYVVMANHVHVLLRPAEVTGQTSDLAEPVKRKTGPAYVPLQQITKKLKGGTARQANQLLNRTGQSFWQAECFDHWVRDEAEFYRIVAYIENNPVKAGLVKRAEDWRWSSAWQRAQQGLNGIQPLK